MGLTTYSNASGVLNGTTTILPSGFVGTITGFSYTNPNVTITTSAAHNLQVGNYIQINAVVQAGTQSINSDYRITAVTSNTFTFSYGATAPSTYTSGGVVRLYTSGADIPTGAYLNGRYIFALSGSSFGNYVYSTDGINWTMGQVPSSSFITSMTFDGTNYIFATSSSGIYSSTTLALGSWTQRTTFGGFWCHDVKWYGGGINRVVAVGSNDTTPSGTGARIETATSGAGTYTNQTISGTASSGSYRNSAWDGANTICAISSSNIAISTSGAGSWTGYAGTATFNASGTGVPGMLHTSSAGIFYNSIAGKWVTLRDSNSTFHGNASTTTPAGVWTTTCPQDFLTGRYYTSGDTSGYANGANGNTWIVADGFLWTHKFIGPTFQIFKWSLTPKVEDTGLETYPLLDVIQGEKIPALIRYSGASTTIGAGQYCAVYGANKWVVCNVGTSRYLATQFYATLLQ